MFYNVPEAAFIKGITISSCVGGSTVFSALLLSVLH